jgi:SagB-type dehydrogenase family enzyme
MRVPVRLIALWLVSVGFSSQIQGEERMTVLPKPQLKGSMSLEETLVERRSVRSFRSKVITMSQVGQLLWASCGLNPARKGRRTVPSAGALYPLDVYVIAGAGGVETLEPGVYYYVSDRHALEMVASGDKRQEVAAAALGQMWMAQAPIMVVITGEYDRTTVKYRERGIRYVQIEVGHAGQNLFLQSVALGLGAGIVGAFDDSEVGKVMELSPQHVPFLIMPVGYPR